MRTTDTPEDGDRLRLVGAQAQRALRRQFPDTPFELVAMEPVRRTAAGTPHFRYVLTVGAEPGAVPEEPPTIVAEITQGYENAIPNRLEGNPTGLAQRFESVIEVNRVRGYRLRDWRMTDALAVHGTQTSYAQTIVAVFERDLDMNDAHWAPAGIRLPPPPIPTIP